MDTVATPKNKIHPHKFTLWVAIASMIMMFAGLTSAYIVKGSLPGWTPIILPKLFYFSTFVILISSVTIQLSVKYFKDRQRNKYQNFLIISFLLGTLFLVLQWISFTQLYEQGIKMEGAGPGQFLYIIFGLHGLHIVGGMIALVVMLLKAFSAKVKTYSPVSIEILATYWHFVDFLWLYLFVFFLLKF